MKIIIVLLALSCICFAEVWYVHPDSVMNTIQEAIDSAGVYDTVLVATGTYHENIYGEGKALYLISESGPAVTIIDGDSVDRVIWSRWDGFAEIRGFTIMNGIADWGAGVVIADNFHFPLVFVDNIVVNNVATLVGAGMRIHGSYAIVRNCYILNNTTLGVGYAGGICVTNDSGTVIDSCRILNNTGDGILAMYSEPVIINYNDIYGNSRYGVCYSDSDTTITINAEYNWWGDSSGPGGEGPGTGDSVSMYVDYDPWLTGPVGVIEYQKKNVQTKMLVYPNPFQNKVYFDGEGIVYDESGRKIKEVYNFWDGYNSMGKKLSSGVYFLRKDNLSVKLVMVR